MDKSGMIIFANFPHEEMNEWPKREDKKSKMKCCKCL